jgi:hypothetical protein
MLAPLTRAAADEQPAQAKVEQEYLSNIQEAARQLARGVEYLQDDIIADLGEQKERSLYVKTDAVLAALGSFQAALKPGVSRAQLYKDFEPLELKLEKLLTDVDALDSRERVLHRDAGRVRAAEEQLHYSLSAGDVTTDRMKQVMERQARALAVAARDLDRVAQYALEGAPAESALPADTRKFAQAAEQFQKGLATTQDRDLLRKNFKAVSQAWERVIQDLKALKPGGNIYLLRRADRVDQLYERLYRALGIPGERPKLILRT